MKIKDLLECIIDNRGKTPPIASSGHCLLEINCIAGKEKYPQYELIKKFVDEETYGSWFRSGHPKKGDVLIPTVGTLNAIGFMDRDDCCIAQNMIAFRTNHNVCTGEYLYYLLCDPMVRQRLLQLDIGAVQPSIKVPHLKNLEVNIPSIDIQKKIVGILTTLDEKIHLNNIVNKNLMEQAKAIYTEMFIVNSNQSWMTGTLTDLITVKYGKDHKKLDDGQYPVYGSGGIMRYVERPLYDKESVLIYRVVTLLDARSAFSK